MRVFFSISKGQSILVIEFDVLLSLHGNVLSANGQVLLFLIVGLLEFDGVNLLQGVCAQSPQCVDSLGGSGGPPVGENCD